MYKTFLKIWTVLFLTGSCLLWAQGQTATGIGYGLTKDAAVEQAKRDAVEQGLGAYMTSSTTVTATSIEDNIYSKAQGFVKSFKIVKEMKGPDGNFEITIEAQVTDMIDQVMADEAALQTLLNAMNRPRIIFMVREENLIDNTPTDFAETKLLSMFYDKGFDVVDRQLVQALRGKQDYEQALAGNVSAAAKIAAQLGAEVIVIGTAKISSGGKVYNMHSGQADINAKIIRADTGEILAVVPQARGKKPHISPSTSGVNAANDGAEKLGKNIGDDFKEGKMTLPIILALRRSNKIENNFWKKTIQDGQIDPGDFQKACSILKKRKVLDDIYTRAKHYGAIAKDALGTVSYTHLTLPTIYSV